MLNSIIVRIFLTISFFFFGYNLVYIILLKKRNRLNEKNNEVDNRLKETRLFARIGIIIINIFITLCCLNIFFYNYWKQIFPTINFLILSDLIQVIGITLIISGNIVLLIAYRKLGIYWSYPMDGLKKRKLITSGIYGHIRHPIYLSFNLFCIGYNMLLLDWLLLILYIIGGIGLYLQAIDEEKILIEYFGEEYIEYMKNTGRFFAKIFN